MNASHAQRTVTAPGPSQRSTGITARPPRVLVLSPQHAATVEGAIDPAHVRQLADTGRYTRPPDPAVVVYRMEIGQHQQTGVVVEVSVDEYRSGRIRRHEATQPERERQIEELTERYGIEQMPVTLVHPGRQRLRALLDEIAAGEPDVRLNSVDGTAHTVWTRHDADLARTVQDEIGHIESLCIADGHHRMAAAERYARRRSEDHAGAFTLATLFPSTEMRVLGYHRCLPMPRGVSAPEILERLAAQPMIARVEECAPAEAHPAPGIVTMRLGGRHYLLWLHALQERDHVRASLDAVTLGEQLLPAVRDIAEADSGSSSPSGEAGCWCAHQDAIRFLPHPPSVDQVLAVSDAGLVMPAKSTWFHPKASTGLFARELV